MRRLLAAFLILATSGASQAATGPVHLVADLNPGDGDNATFASFTRLGDRVLFATDLRAEKPCPLWSTDGTATGTERLADLCGGEPFSASWVPTAILAVNGHTAFLTGPDRQLWRSDGTAGGTFSLGVEVSRLNGNTLLDPGGILYFVACSPDGDCEPWRSDGTPAGTRMLRAVQTGVRGSAIYFAVAGDRVLFSALGKKGPALWSTDGTRRGTQELVRLPRVAWHLQAVDGALYVSASDSEATTLWVVPAGGRTVRRLGAFPSHHRGGVDLFKVGGRLLLGAHDEDGFVDLWEITPPHHRPRFLVQFEGGVLGPIAAAGGGLVLAATVDSDIPFSLWFLGPGMSRPQPVSGCPGGCPEVVSFAPSRSFDLPAAGFGVLGGRLLFAGRDAGHGSELWETDGTGPGTRLVFDLCPGACDGSPSGFTAALGRLLFTAGERDLWVTDGTTADTLPLGQILATSPYGLDLAAANGRVIFNGFDEVEGSQLWVSDLTPAGTHPFLSPGTTLAAGSDPGACDPDGQALMAGGGNLFFTADDGEHGRELWVLPLGDPAGAQISPGRR